MSQAELFGAPAMSPSGTREKPAAVPKGHTFATLLSATETARTFAWLAVQRGDWGEAVAAAERAAEGWREFARLAREAAGAGGGRAA